MSDRTRPPLKDDISQIWEKKNKLVDDDDDAQADKNPSKTPDQPLATRYKWIGPWGGVF